jgi:predicted Zn-dependent peptidase
MGQLARQEMYLGRFVSLDEMMGEMNRVTPEGILELAADLIDERVYNLVVMGETAETEKRDLPELMGGGAISRF